MRIDIDYPDFLYLEEGRPSVFCANGSHGMWAMEGKISQLYLDNIECNPKLNININNK
jgi:hypothetical protein